MKKTIVITGATSGIGKQLKTFFENDGNYVINISRSCQNDDNNYQCDVADSKKLKNVFEQISKKHKNIDILINSAGYGISGAVELISEQDSKNIFDVNYFGTLNCIKFALPHMKKGSKIINISSACALFPLPFRTLYCASKSAVSMLSEGLKMELKPAGIDVCNICPGDIKTNFTKNRVKNFETNERYENRIAKAVGSVDSKEHRRMDETKASKIIYKIINKNHYKPLYIVGGKYKFLYILSKIFPKRWIDGAIYKMFGGTK